jgi:hypothetical protein
MTTRPFPAITGGCTCGSVRYRLLTSPLFCYACHCTSCQKSTGSAFALHLSIESYNISIISRSKPSLVSLSPNHSPSTKTSQRALCPHCGTVFWSHDNPWGYAVSDVRIGTLDFPGIMEPDVHSFVGSKLGWVGLPPGAKTAVGHYEYEALWPKSSLRRLEACLERFEERKRGVIGEKEKEKEKEKEGEVKVVDAETREESPVDGDADGEKTPTATGDVDEGGEDDEAFEKRFRETEKALQERLAKLSLKLVGEEEGTKGE